MTDLTQMANEIETTAPKMEEQQQQEEGKNENETTAVTPVKDEHQQQEEVENTESKPEIVPEMKESTPPIEQIERKEKRPPKTPPEPYVEQEQASTSKSRSHHSKKKREHKKRSRSRSRSRSRGHRHSGHSSHKHHSRNRSRSRSRSRSPSRHRHERSKYPRELSPRPVEHKPYGMPPPVSTPCRCLVIFGLNPQTDEIGLHRFFSSFGPIEYINVVRERETRYSRRFAFIYFVYMEDAIMAKEEIDGKEVDGHRVRIDFSLTYKYQQSYRQDGYPREGRSRSRSPYFDYVDPHRY